ncbi:MAG: hypothetical protein ACRDJ1_06465 [Actinomycetota bacterium]
MRRVLLPAILLVSGLALQPTPALPIAIPAIPIPSFPGQNAGPAFLGAPAVAQPVGSFPVPAHPFMAPNGKSNIHNDPYMTDAYTWAGPLGNGIKVNSTWFGLEECASITFDSKGQIVALCGSLDGAKLRVLDAKTLATKTLLPLPPRMVRPGTTPLTDFCAAGYFYLDDKDRAVVATNLNQIWIVSMKLGLLMPEKIFDLNTHVVIPDCMVSVLPDWSGRIWFVSRGAVVGLVNPLTGVKKSLKLAGEQVTNSFAIDETGGVFVVTDRALYRFDADATGAPKITWRATYDYGTRTKPGQLGDGSGTTPTLMAPDMVAITDNADPFMNVEVYRRSTGALVCRTPVFLASPGKGATDNSLIAVGNSLIVENNYGYTGPTAVAGGKSTEPGVERVDVFLNSGTCTSVWTSAERSPTTVPKASLASGLLYLYTKPPRADGVDAWYFTAVDLRTGATVFKRLTGTGYLYNNHYAPVSIGPDGSGYIGTLGGLVRIADVP